MIPDVLSTLSPSQNKNNTDNMTLGNTGTLAKLSNEMKLMEALSFIKFQGSETLQFQGKEVQLLHAKGAQQPFTLINTDTPIDINDLKHVQLNKIDNTKASLTITREALPSQLQQTTKADTPLTNKVDNLTLASRVVNLTVLSTPQIATNKTETQSTNNHASTQKTAASEPVLNNTHASKNANSMTANSLHANVSQTAVPSHTINTSHINTKPATNYLVTVTDGKTEFPIVSQTELKRGDSIRVFIDANNNVQALPKKTENLTSTPQIEALKNSLPKQLSTSDMSQFIKQLNVINESSPTLSNQTQQALKQLMQGLPNLNALTTSPEAMKQAIQTSGVFSESLLLNNNKAELLPDDLKLNLSRLKETQESTGTQRLGSIPTEHIANAIERITTTQLRHFADTSQTGTINYPLHIELPIKDGSFHNLVQIEIDKEAHSHDSNKQERRWLVRLKFDFEETGKFEARTSIQSNKVSIIFVAEEKDTLQKLQKNMQTLKQQLKDKDIEVEKLDTFQAKLEKESQTIPSQNNQLIDVRT